VQFPYLNYNGQLISSKDFSISPANRSFRYGDGLFETIKVAKSKILFYPQHYSRMILGMETLMFDVPEDYGLKLFETAITDLVRKKELKTARVRINIFRGSGGNYLPESNAPEFIIEAEPLEDAYYKTHKAGLKIGLFEKHIQPKGRLSSVKSNNKLPYIIASLFCKQENWDDCIILNTDGNVADATHSNVFISKNGQLITPPEDDGGVGGVMRKVIIKLAKLNGIELLEKSISIDEVKDADELFLSNVIKGIQWVNEFDGIRYKHQMADWLVHKLNEKVAGQVS
jgi:branched-chain amino acid aminotransferase